MKKVFFLFFILFGFNSFSQDLDFNRLLNIFKYKSSYGTIPDDYAVKYFDHDTSALNVGGEKMWLTADEIVYETDSTIALAVSTDCAAGGLCVFRSLHLFTKEGKEIASTYFGSAMADCGFYDGTRCIFVSDSLLVFNEENYEQDCSIDSIYNYRSKLEFVQFKDSEFHSIGEVPIDARRMYYMGSNQVLTKDGLKKYSTEELAAIRNEIFAAHGYIFKTEKWKDYFADKDWYRPRYDDVLDSLTVIERLNVELLLALEKKSANQMRAMRTPNPIVVVDGFFVDRSEAFIKNYFGESGIRETHYLNSELATKMIGELGKNGLVLIMTKEKNNLKSIELRSDEYLLFDDHPQMIINNREVKNVNLESIDPQSIESIEIISPFEAVKRFGPARKGGIIKIVLKEK